MTGRFSIPLPVWGSLIGSLLLRIASAASATLTALILAGPYLPSVSGDINLAGLITLGSASLLSLFTGAFYLAELSTAPIFGVLSDRSGRRRFMEIGVACGAVAITLLIVGVSLESTVKLPAAVTILILLTIFFLKGFSTASSAPATLGYIAETSIEDVGLRGRIVGVYEIATAGGLIGGAVLGAKLWDRFGPDALFASLASYLLAAVAFSMVREVSNRSGEWARDCRILGRIEECAPSPVCAGLVGGKRGSWPMAHPRRVAGSRGRCDGTTSGRRIHRRANW